MYRRVAEADEAADTTALAALAWELYGLVGSLVADRDALRARLQGSARPDRAGGREPAGKRLRGAYRTTSSEPPRPSPGGG